MTSRAMNTPFPSERALRLPASVTSVSKRAPAPTGRSLSASRIGAHVKTLRLASGTPASRLAKLAGISASLLSRVERGLVSPSVETLDRIAEGLRVPVSRLLSDGGRRMDFCHVPAGRGITVDRVGADSDHRYELLGHLLSGSLFAEPYLVTLLPDAEPCVTLQHPGVKFLYFLSGRIAYRYGSKTVSVGAGDSLLFDATSLHGIEAVDSGPVSYLSVLLALRD